MEIKYMFRRKFAKCAEMPLCSGHVNIVQYTSLLGKAH